jgi:hypothetical protein
MMGNTSYMNIFKEVASVLYGQNSLMLQDVYSLAPYERHGMIDLFNSYMEDNGPPPSSGTISPDMAGFQ